MTNAIIKLQSSGDTFNVKYDYNYPAGSDDQTYIMKRMVLMDGRVLDIIWDNIEYIQYVMPLTEYAAYCEEMYSEHHAPDIEDMDGIEVVDFRMDDTNGVDNSMFG